MILARVIAVSLTVFSIGVSSDLTAEPRVLYDTGKTVSIAPYLAPLQPKQPEIDRPPSPPAVSAAGFGLPVRSPSLSPGRVNPRSLPKLHGKMAAARPLFLIGADRWSLQWLDQNRDRLAELQAAGMVVQVETEQDLQILRQAAGDLTIFPASGEAFANALGLRHYPVLIAPPGVIQQ